MKYKTFSVMMILALVSSLCIIMTMPSPAGADVSTPSVSVSPDTAGSAAQWAITFSPSATGTITPGDTVTIEFPSSVTVPTSIDYRNVWIHTSGTPTKINAAQAGVSVSGQQVTVTNPTDGYRVNSTQTMTITISQVAGIKNPSVSSHSGDGTAYYVKVSTSREPTQVTSSAITINDWVTASPMQLAYMGATTVKAYGFKPGSSIFTTATSGAVGSGTVGSDGTATFTAFGTGFSAPITVQDGTGRQASTATSTTVLPRITVTPTSGLAGSLINITGYDFGDTPNLTSSDVKIGGTAFSAGTFTVKDVDGDGIVDDFTYVNAQVPTSMDAGVKTITAQVNPGSPIAQASFEVLGNALSVSPASGAPGSQITVSGTGFPPNQHVWAVYLIKDAAQFAVDLADDGEITSDETSAVELTSTSEPTAIDTDSSGAFTIPCTVTTNLAAGSYGIIVFVPNATGAKGTGLFTVTGRTVTINPTSGPKGTKVTISGGNLTANSTVAANTGIKFGTNNWNTSSYGGGTAISLDSQGNLTPVTLEVGNFSTGKSTIYVTDAAGLVATGTFEITVPTCTFEPTSAVRGDLITVTGSGWLPTEIGLVSIYLDINGDGTYGSSELVAFATPDAEGKIYKQFTVPSNVTPNTIVYYRAQDTKGNTSIPGALTIPAARVEVSPTSAPVGSSITVKGAGFLPSTGVTSVTMGGVTLIPGQAVVTDSQGRFTVTATVPGLAVGGQAISATVGATTASTAFIITAGGAAPVTPAVATANIASQLQIMWTFDGATQTWKVYDPTPGATSDISAMTAGQGYWVKVSENCSLVYGNKTYNLYAGWNLIGWQG